VVGEFFVHHDESTGGGGGERRGGEEEGRGWHEKSSENEGVQGVQGERIAIVEKQKEAHGLQCFL
jgi:hypothetical protein